MDLKVSVRWRYGGTVGYMSNGGGWLTGWVLISKELDHLVSVSAIAVVRRFKNLYPSIESTQRKH